MADDPGSALPGRIMTHVDGVPALELRDPLPLVIQVKSHNAARLTNHRNQDRLVAYTLGVRRSR
jgi:hypothetical protein